MNVIKIDTINKNTTHRMIEILNNNEITSDTTLDFSSTFFRPFATLLLISTIKKQLSNQPIKYLEKGDNYSRDTLKIYKYLEGGYNYKSIYDLNINDLEICTFDINSFFDLENKIQYDKIQQVVNEFTKRLSGLSEDKFLTEFFNYSFREILRNSVEHSYANNVTIYVNKIESSKYFELAIFDDGRGLEYSLSKNKELKEMLNKGANSIDIALTPGLSSHDNLKYLRPTDIAWRNSGFGLAIVKSICMKLNGVFAICSNDQMKLFKKFQNLEENFKVNIKGVGILVRFHVYDSKASFEALFNEAISELELESNKSASAMSKIIN